MKRVRAGFALTHDIGMSFSNEAILERDQHRNRPAERGSHRFGGGGEEGSRVEEWVYVGTAVQS